LRDKTLVELAKLAQQELGEGVFDDHNEFRTRFDATMKAHSKKLGAPEKKAIYKAVSWRDDTAPPVIAKRSKLKAGGSVTMLPLRRSCMWSVSPSTVAGSIIGIRRSNKVVC
jgi:hypothetical protein